MIFDIAVLITILILLVLGVSKLKVHPFIALLVAGLSLGLLLGFSGEKAVDVLLSGFGNTLKWIAIVVILGAYIGEVLHETGGALRISNAVVKWVGERKLPWAMGITGYLVSIPVFVDVAYIILQPITEALAGRSKKPVLVIGLSLTAGLTVSHTLIPPTPGPLAVASLLNADLGRLLLINAFAGLMAMAGGILFAAKFCHRFPIPYDEQLSLRAQEEKEKRTTTIKKPSVLLDMLPILIPVLLMASGAFCKDMKGTLGTGMRFISMPMIAVLVGAAVAYIQYYPFRRYTPSGSLVEKAIVKSALVIMITGAGGAFGYIIRESGIQDTLTLVFSDLPFLGFLLPFLMAAVLTTATGSITVSLIGTASIVGPLAGTMPYSAEMMAALIGCGAFCVFHANSSFFWLLNRLHEVPLPILYRTYTVQSLLMGVSGLIGVAILWMLGVD